MKHFTTWIFLIAVTIAFSACHCNTQKCHVGLPGLACTPCPTKPKPLKPPKAQKECHPLKWPDRPVRFVSTQVIRKCCETECGVTPDGLHYEIEVCEITYKGIYTDGSSKIWTEVSRNPIVRGASSIKTQNTKEHLRVGSLVGNRGDRP